MISTSMIGAISLNCAFILYLLVYLPQLMHNRESQNIAALSLNMHFILYVSYCLDLFYGFSCNLQWQYKTVSIVGCSLLTIQHLQITHYFWKKHLLKIVKLNLLMLCLVALVISCFFIMAHSPLTKTTSLMIGYTARVCFIIYVLPQIMKNKRMQSTQAISLNFICLNLTLSVLDMTSAWCLDWGWPNKLGSPVMVTLMFILLLQRAKYSSVGQKGRHRTHAFLANISVL